MSEKAKAVQLHVFTDGGHEIVADVTEWHFEGGLSGDEYATLRWTAPETKHGKQRNRLIAVDMTKVVAIVEKRIG